MFLTSGGNSQAVRDNCSKDGNWIVKIRAPQDHYYIDCNNGNSICLSCFANLHWSPKCQKCEFYKNGKTLIPFVQYLVKNIF